MADVYEIVTERIVQSLEQGVVPWQKPWASTGVPRNYVSKKAYRGMNVILLSIYNYSSPYWLTFKQAQDQGWKVRKGEKSAVIAFWNFTTKTTGEDQDTEVERARAFLRYYNVFNLEQLEGVPAELLQPGDGAQEIRECQAVVDAMPNRPTLGHGGDQAFYSPAMDHVQMPPQARFKDSEGYYATLFHELCHATGHTSRLDRKGATSAAAFGSEDYGKEELVAEIGSALLCAETGIFPRVADNSASYLQGWLNAIKADKRLIPFAAAQAQKAADYILGAEHGE